MSHEIGWPGFARLLLAQWIRGLPVGLVVALSLAAGWCWRVTQSAALTLAFLGLAGAIVGIALTPARSAFERAVARITKAPDEPTPRTNLHQRIRFTISELAIFVVLMAGPIGSISLLLHPIDAVDYGWIAYNVVVFATIFALIFVAVTIARQTAQWIAFKTAGPRTD